MEDTGKILDTISQAIVTAERWMKVQALLKELSASQPLEKKITAALLYIREYVDIA